MARGTLPSREDRRSSTLARSSAKLGRILDASDDGVSARRCSLGPPSGASSAPSLFRRNDPQLTPHFRIASLACAWIACLSRDLSVDRKPLPLFGLAGPVPFAAICAEVGVVGRLAGSSRSGVALRDDEAVDQLCWEADLRDGSGARNELSGLVVLDSSVEAADVVSPPLLTGRDCER
jgi:hypothetical protein